MESLYPTSSVQNRSTKEAGVVYCTKCGFPCRTVSLIPRGGAGNSRHADKRFPVGSKAGKGVSYISWSYSSSTAGFDYTGITFDQSSVTFDQATVTRTMTIPDVNAGCPFCGTYLYDVGSSEAKAP